MKPKSIKLLSVVLMLTSCSQHKESNLNSTSSTDLSSISTSTVDSTIESEYLISDSNFETGFNLLTTSTDNGREVAKVLDYEGKAIGKSVWQMAQWWSPYDFSDSAFRENNGTYIYENESRVLRVNPSTGSLTMELDSNIEYLKKYGGPRTASSQSWSHFLIEQNFNKKTSIAQAKRIIASIDLKIDEVTSFHKEEYNRNLHTAQMIWYFTIQNILPEGADPELYGKHGDYMWFGIPFFDARYETIAQSANVDSGTTGSTNKLIYSIASESYIKDKPIIFGKEYHIEIDLLPYVKDAFVYGILNGALQNCQFENMQFNYMNLGWELPGSYKIRSEIKNISVRVDYEK